ncbi:unnamed protein product [Cuscuta epithymum]|nr:unnamed protein product [Cuscuta epithymum]
MANNENRTIRNLAMPNLDNQPLCIQYPELEAALELRSGLIQLLPKFHGLPGEDPHKHLKEFHVVCSTMKPTGVPEDHIKLRAFPFSLDGAAKDWLYYLPSGCITSWNDMKKMFLENYFPATRTAVLRKEICGIKQTPGETLYEYRERFKKLCQICPHHQYTEVQLIQYFYEGLLPVDRVMLDAASGGALIDKTPVEAWRLTDTMAANSHQFGMRQDVGVKQVNEVASSNLEQQLAATNQQLSQLTALMMTQMNLQQTKNVCGVCSSNAHFSDQCPLVQGKTEEANAMGFPGSSQRRFDPFSNTYNPGWKSHPNLSYGNNNNSAFQSQPQHMPGPGSSQSGAPNQNSTSTLEGMMQRLVDGQLKLEQEKLKFEQETRVGMQDLRTQVGQLATSMSRLESQLLNRLPSQPMNPNQSANAITLRSGKILSEDRAKKVSFQLDQEKETEVKSGLDDEPDVSQLPDQKKTMSNDLVCKLKNDKEAIPSIPANVLSPPFPSRLAKKQKESLEKDIWDTFRKVEVNIPLIDAIKQVPRYAKFLKELCTNKRKLRGDERVSLNENVSAVLQRKLPVKCKDKGSFSIPVTIGNKRFERAMCDLGASINVMPYSVYTALNIGPLIETGVIIQLADRSNVYPEGLVEDVLVQVGDLVFPADFFVLKMEDNELDLTPIPLLLGRPFLRTARTQIDVFKGILTMEFDGNVVRFDIFEAMRYPNDVHAVFSIDALDVISEQVMEFEATDSLSLVLRNSLNNQTYNALKLAPKEEIEEMIAALEALPVKSGKFNLSYIDLPVPTTKLFPSIVQPPEVELKPLPSHLKYAFMGSNETLPVIFSSELTPTQEDKLIRVLREYKEAIGWNIADIKGISPAICMHRILLEDGAKPVRQPQRRLNPPMMDVVKKEVMKLLEVGIIYPISDSEWVSPTQVVPKKSGLTSGFVLFAKGLAKCKCGRICWAFICCYF